LLDRSRIVELVAQVDLRTPNPEPVDDLLFLLRDFEFVYPSEW
jgi:hypothetical protein